MDLGTLKIAAVVMIVIGVGMIYLIAGRKRKIGSPAEWVGVGMSTLLVVFAGVMLTLGFTIGNEVRGPFSEQKSAIGQDAPSFSFTLLESEESRTLADYRGEVVLLNFWATWCPPCLDEMPDLNRIYAEYKDQGVRVITISDEAREELVAFEDIVSLETESGYIDDARTLPSPFIKILEGRPESYVIDRDGKIREFIMGARNYEFFKASITPYL